MSQPHGPNCWNTAKCPSPNEQCFVQLKTAAAGLAHCRATCPSHGWLCETRVPDENGGAACGPAPLPKSLVQPTDAMRAVMADASDGAVKLCDRANPPRGVPTFEITCYDGGQTGNRYVMVKSLLARAACCGGIALLPPEFDHFPQSGAACFDFRGAPSTLSRPGSAACAANVSENSKRWWGPHLKQTEAHCPASAEAARLVALAAKVYVGFGVPGLVFRDRSCAAISSAASASAHTLHIHMRSGEIFTNWQNGSHLTTHGGFQHEPWSRGQPPLSFYAAVAAHAHPGATKQPSSTPSPAASGLRCGGARHLARSFEPGRPRALAAARRRLGRLAAARPAVAPRVERLLPRRPQHDPLRAPPRPRAFVPQLPPHGLAQPARSVRVRADRGGVRVSRSARHRRALLSGRRALLSGCPRVRGRDGRPRPQWRKRHAGCTPLVRCAARLGGPVQRL